MSTPAIEIKKLLKTYPADLNQPPVVALDGVDLTIQTGEIFVLLGPNGAGKSTLINILAGIARKTSGTANVLGYDVERDYRITRRLLGVVPQETNYDPFFTTEKILGIASGLMGVAKKDRWTEEIMERLQLTKHRNKNSRSLSGGMKRRLLVAKALVHRPKILILDEPTAGVDIQLRQELWNFVLELHAQGMTILLTTHYLQEADRVAQRVAFINHGRIEELGTPSELKAKYKKKNLEEIYLHLVKNGLSEESEEIYE